MINHVKVNDDVLNLKTASIYVVLELEGSQHLRAMIVVTRFCSQYSMETRGHTSMSSNGISSCTRMLTRHGESRCLQSMVLVMFLRTKTLPKGGSNVRTTVLQEVNRKCKCKCRHGLGTKALTGFRGQETT